MPNSCLKIRDIIVDGALKETRRKICGVFNLFTPVPEDGNTRSFRNVGPSFKEKSGRHVPGEREIFMATMPVGSPSNHQFTVFNT